MSDYASPEGEGFFPSHHAGETRGEVRRLRDALSGVVRNQVIPRLKANHRTRVDGRGREPAETAAGLANGHVPRLREATSQDVDRLIALIGTHGPEAARAYLEGLMTAGVDRTSLFVDVLAPAARRIGDMWLRDDCGFTDVTLGVGKLQRLLREMSARHTGERHDPNAPAILLAPYPGEQHVFGVAMIEEMFREAGWRVTALQACPTHDVASALGDSAYDVIGLSLSRDELVPGVPRTLQSLRLASRNPDVRILVGGPTFSHDPDLWRKVGADEMAVDGREAVIRAHSLLANLHAGC